MLTIFCQSISPVPGRKDDDFVLAILQRLLRSRERLRVNVSHTLGVQAPLASLSSIEADLEFSIDRSNRAAAAAHTVCDFWKSHFARTQQRDDAIQFILSEVFTL